MQGVPSMRFSTGFAARGRSSLAFHTNATSSTDSTKVHEQERSARNNQRDRSRELNSAVDVPPLESSVNGKSQLHRATIFGNQGPKQISLLEQLGNDGAGPRFTSPVIADQVRYPAPSNLPIMIYLPGIDGTGMAASRQFPDLVKAFELHTLVIPPDDRSGFSDLVAFIKEYLTGTIQPSANGRPVYLLGESFGGLLALATAKKCQDAVDRIVLVNPATSYEQSVWPTLAPLLPQIPKEAYNFLPFAFSPLFGNPIQLLARNIDMTAAPDVVAGQLLEGILQLFGSLEFITDILSPNTLAWKLELVQQGVDYTREIIPKVQQRVFLLAGEGDWMLPSGDEAKRLESLLPRCYSKKLEWRSHALLQEVGIDLAKIMKEEGFYVTERRLSSPLASHANSRGSNFGVAAPVELPTDIELERATKLLVLLRSLASPVFLSTLEDGSIVRGFAGIPSDRPVLFVGNHQTLAPDTGLLVEELLREKGMLLRGLAHPSVSQNEPSSDSGPGNESDGALNDLAKFLTTFGAVPVSPTNFYKLLSQDENVLLYPGGVREAFKRRDEKYQVFWPEKSEFVRMAARFGATIVPLASIGAEDSLSILLDSQDLSEMPVIGNYNREKAAKVPSARKGVNAHKEVQENFVQPLVVPGVPQRYYFLMQKPIQTSVAEYKDKDRCQAIYREVKSQVEAGISYLAEKREEDPYKDILSRTVYERSLGGKQAPTFKL